VIYLTPLYFGEKGVAERLKALARAGSINRVMNHMLFADEQLSGEQRSAIEMALTHPVSVLTGGPGTGEDHLLKALITTLETQA
jgi:exodeoxyribonuclease V alpha subunit